MSDNSSEILLAGAGSSGDSVFSGFGSDLNTPAWSEIDDSTETTHSEEEEEDGDDFIAELTRQMAENMLQGDEYEDENSITSKSNRSWKYYCHGQGHMSTTKSQTPTSVLPNPTTQIYPNQSQPKHEYRQVQNREYAHGGGRRAGFLSALLQAGPGMRVVFLGGVGPRSSGSSGTGVFLPHPPNSNAAAAAKANHHQSRKKTGCSTVLIPERVLLTLKHHFEKRNAHRQIHSNIAAQQNQGLQSHETIRNNQESQLPQEWTY